MEKQHQFTQSTLNQIDQQNTSVMTSLMPLFYTLGLSSILVSAFYFILKHFWEQIKKQFFSFVYLENNDPIFKYVQEYLTDVGLIKSNISSLTASLEKTANEPWWKKVDHGTDDYKPTIKYTPSSGNHKFKFKNKTIFVYHSVGNTLTVGWERTPQKQEVIRLWCFGKKNVNLLQEILDQAFLNAQNKDKDKTNIYAIHEWWCSWDKVQAKEPRGFESVILDENLADSITEDLQSFLNNQNWYHERGVPYRRGYLLYGPPGTGKTSFILAIAGKLGLNICTVNLSGNRLNDDSLNRLLESTPKRSIILLEDVDAIFVERDSVSQKGKGQKVSFSGLLNALDGVRSQEGRILFMTTNHKEKLDPALMRPGRADVHVKLNFASEKQAKELFLKFFPEEKELADKFSKQIPEYKISMAKLQGQFLKYKKNPQLALDNIGELLDISADYNKEMTIVDWLLRLGLEDHAHKFLKQNIKRIQDLAQIQEKDLEPKFGIKTIGHQKRIMGVINNETEIIRQFKKMSSNSLRGFFKAILSNYSQEFQDKIIDIVPENCVTEFQLRDIIDRKFDNNEEHILEEIDKLVQRNQSFEKNPKLKSQFELEKQEQKKKLNFEIYSQKVFKELDLEEYYETLENFNLQDSINFLEIDEQIVKETLKIENIGKQKNLLRQIKKLKDEKVKLEKLLDENEKSKIDFTLKNQDDTFKQFFKISIE